MRRLLTLALLFYTSAAHAFTASFIQMNQANQSSGGGGGRTVFASDNFTAADGTNLAGRTPDLGGTWTDRDSCACEQIYSNALSMTASVSKWSYYVNTAPTSADYDVEATIQQASAGNVTPGIAGRINSSATNDTEFFLYWDGGTSWVLYKFVNGSATSLGTFTGNTPTTPVTIRLSMTGTTIQGIIAGTTQISVTDSSISAKGFPGIKGYFPDLDSSHIRKVDSWAAYQ